MNGLRHRMVETETEEKKESGTSEKKLATYNDAPVFTNKAKRRYYDCNITEVDVDSKSGTVIVPINVRYAMMNAFVVVVVAADVA